VHDGQHALHQVEVETLHAGHAAELFADQRFFGGAVHLHDADGGAHVVANCFGYRELGQDRRGGAAAGVVGVAVIVVVIVVMVVRMIVALGMAVVLPMIVVVTITVTVPMTIFGCVVKFTCVILPRMPVGACSAVFVTAHFGVAGVLHGGFLAGFVV
jgi:hypothetical protein